MDKINELNDEILYKVEIDWDSCGDYTSKSRISTYTFCPLQYKKKYVDGIRDTSFNYAMTVGSRFHEFADNFFDFAPIYPKDKWEDFIHSDFNDNERISLSWFINQERERLELFDGDMDLWMPIVRECKIVDPLHKLRGIVDRVDKINDLYIIVEYKTSKSIYKPSLQREFGFYKILLQADPRFKGKKFLGCVINPRLKQIEFMNPSRESTVEKMIFNLRESVANGIYIPTCSGAKFAMCGLCTSCEEANLYQEYKNLGNMHGI
ncbi:MAG: PD-(D/E)XK nuclease family protein [Dehalococcoidales bacterium]|jgi:hypothetical protein